jgi:hypothetical protein
MARERQALPRDFPDRAIRDALTTPDNLRTVLRRAVPALAEQLDYTRMEVVPPSFLLDDWRQRDADVLVRIPLLARVTLGMRAGQHRAIRSVGFEGGLLHRNAR